MKNYSMGVKLMGGFIIVVLIAVFVGIFGIVKLKQVDNLGTVLFENGVKPMGEIAQLSTAYQQTRFNVLDIILTSYDLRDPSVDIQQLAELDSAMDGYVKNYAKTLVSEEGKKDFANLMEAIKKYAPLRAKMIELAKMGHNQEAVDLMTGEAGAVAKQISDTIIKINKKTIDSSQKISAGNTATANAAVTVTIIVTVLGTIIAFLLGFFLSRSITGSVKRVAVGLSEGSDQVASAASQVSAASQSLAEGASEQASALEETSASIEELSAMTSQNAENANQANNLMAETGRVVNEANGSMQELTGAMQEITTGSEDMAKIIKTIDEIAFQTNLLALNAAVEAARAGEAGAGFAVVADEVRNLALRSAEAAKNTANLIDESIKRIKNGSTIVEKTNGAFGRVLGGAKKVGDLVSEIAAASNEQAQGILQISKAFSEMDKVIQQNAASAEESASASEELSAQALQMKEFVGDMITVIQGNDAKGVSASTGHIETLHRRRTALTNKRAVKSIVSRKTGEISASGARIVNPEQVIPMGDHDEFKDF
ncbi:MAG: methyl-accepting chemotaxis protein [Syntrophales bacterium]